MVKAKIWFTGESIALELPPSDDEPGHIVEIPLAKLGIECNGWGSPKASQLGWNALLYILKQRYSKEHTQRAPIASKASPVKYDLEKMLKQVQIVGKKRRASEELSLEDLDL